MTTRIEIRELDHEGVRAQLDGSTATSIADSQLLEVRPEGEGWWRLRPRGRVGAVRIDDVEAVVIGKVRPASLLYLLGYAKNPGFQPSDVSGLPDDDLWAALAEALARQAERALGRGVLQGYVTLDEALHLVRGRIRVADQIARRAGLLLPIEVTYDEYTVDVAENQILRTALRRVLGLARLRPEHHRRLAHLDGRLDGVTVLPRRSRLPRWLPTRLNERYYTALALAEIVLDERAVAVAEGPAQTAAFVVNMAKAFEDFVAVALTKALGGRDGHTYPQYPTVLDAMDRSGKHSYKMAPDVVHVIDDHPVAVFDAKYKLEGTDGFPNADAYQMLAYCTALRLKRGWLVYAEGSPGREARRVRHTDISIVEYPLDLSAHPFELERQVQGLASEALGHECRNLAPTRAGQSVGVANERRITDET